MPVLHAVQKRLSAGKWWANLIQISHALPGRILPYKVKLLALLLFTEDSGLLKSSHDVSKPLLLLFVSVRECAHLGRTRDRSLERDTKFATLSLSVRLSAVYLRPIFRNHWLLAGLHR